MDFTGSNRYNKEKEQTQAHYVDNRSGLIKRILISLFLLTELDGACSEQA